MAHIKNIFLMTICGSLAILIAACGAANQDQKVNSDRQAIMVGQFLGKNPSMHIRKWDNTYYVSGTVVASKVGRADDGRIPAALGCFNWIYYMDGESTETKSNMCIYYIFSSSDHDSNGRVTWRGDRAQLEAMMAEDGFEK